MDINATLLVEVVIFLGFVTLTMRYVWPPILAVLKERQLHIEQGLRNTDQAKQTLEDAHAVADNLVHQARKKADEMIESAQIEAGNILTKAKQDCDEYKKQTELTLIATQNKLKLSAEKKIREKVSEFCMAICKKVLNEKTLSSEVEKKVLNYFTLSEEI